MIESRFKSMIGDWFEGLPCESRFKLMIGDWFDKR
jgi:hypothetical protein